MYICISSSAFCELLCRHCYDDDPQVTRQTIALALLDLPSLLPPYFWWAMAPDLQIYCGCPRSTSCTPLNCWINSMDTKLVCPFCLKADETPPTSTHACVSYDTPMYAWCGFCSCSKQELKAAVALEYLPFLYGWKPTANHWERPTAISSGSTANAVRFLQHRMECQAL